MKLWKISERCYAPSNFNLRDDQGVPRNPEDVTSLRVPVFRPSELVVEASPRRVYANAHTYHINSISLNSDDETYLSADDLRINLWHLGINDQSYSILLFCNNNSRYKLCIDNKFILRTLILGPGSLKHDKGIFYFSFLTCLMFLIFPSCWLNCNLGIPWALKNICIQEKWYPWSAFNPRLIGLWTTQPCITFLILRSDIQILFLTQFSVCSTYDN